jgi:hypothetical protein
MPEEIKSKSFNRCITINSLIYFLIAYYLVVFSFNIFSSLLTSWLGFDVELYYYGFTHSGKKWTTDNMLLVFFVGNALTLVTAFIFQVLYRRQRKYSKGYKLLFLWLYLISLIWFVGNIIVGAFFNFGIGTALRAFHVPFFLRLVLATVGVFILLFLGYKAQKHVMVAANLYYPKIYDRNILSYFLHQIVWPILLGLGIIVLLKIPHLPEYNYVDLYVLLSFVFFLGGLLFKYKSLETMRFKSHEKAKKQLQTKHCGIAYVPLVICILIIVAVRVGLMNGVAF